MSQPEEIEIGVDDIQSLAGKLATLFAGLTAEEQAILDHVLQAAAENAGEVSGFAAADFGFGMGLAPGLATAVGMHDISITKTVDKSSPKLYLLCAKGEHFKQASL